MAEHKVIRVAGDQALQSKLDEMTATGWELVTVMPGQANDVLPQSQLNPFVVLFRRPGPR